MLIKSKPFSIDVGNPSVADFFWDRVSAPRHYVVAAPSSQLALTLLLMLFIAPGCYELPIISGTRVVYVLKLLRLFSLATLLVVLNSWIPTISGCQMLYDFMGFAVSFATGGRLNSRLVSGVACLSEPPRASSRRRSFPAVVGGGKATFSGESLVIHRVLNDAVVLDGSSYSFEFQCPESEVIGVRTRNPDCVAVVIPLDLVLGKLTRPEMLQISKLHGVWLPTRLPVSVFRQLLADHRCASSCEDICTIFRCVDKDTSHDKSKRQKLASYSSAARQQKSAYDLAEKVRLLKRTRHHRNDQLNDTEFPPRPLSFRHLHRLLTKNCNGMRPSRFLEEGCAVCGCLTPLRELGPLDKLMPYLGILCAPGVTKCERFSVADLPDELDGPVLASGCNKVCVNCETAVVNKKIPKNALVVHNWLGEVPPELQGLSYAEKLMIAKVRHNRCVVRVNSGRMRMSVNAIMFSQPILKVYHKLPPSREEMHEILAFIYTGSAPPTQEDFDRTPMLVRRSKVLAALEWLKLNHDYYSELEISMENLATYAERDIPVSVDFRRSNQEPEDSVPNVARAVNDSGEEYGTESGECTFSVHGLTGEEYAHISLSTLKVLALEHITRGGGVLGIGQSEKPVSMYDSVEAYPSMFPWLFPYGRGGIGHPSHKKKQSDTFRKNSLLMYHDQRFQSDTYFPMITFNHEQLKASSTASKLLADKSKFTAVKMRLNAINPVVAGNIADRFASGEHVKPVTDAEKLCFDLVKDLDTVAGRVHGSMTSKKYMRNEIWSTTSFFNAPTWFITLAWADMLHPIALYYAQTDTVYRPEMRTATERYRLMSKNPVSAAHFFNFMVKAFITDVLGWQCDERGVFGHTKAFYGSVEQQGRLTLHLHLLLWIENALSPQKIRDRVMDPNSMFQQNILRYLESCHQAEFIQGSLVDVQARVKIDPKLEASMSGTPAYIPPTHTLPSGPPPICRNIRCPGTCSECAKFVKWWDRFGSETDDLMLRVNLHSHFHSTEDEQEKERKKDWRVSKKAKLGVKKVVERRGCMSRNKVCKARFPRTVVNESSVTDDGHINVRHIEPMINPVNPILTYISRCNSDVTSMLSGTAVKAVISYVSDYVSKVALKSYQLFASVFQVFDASSEMLQGEEKNHERSRHLIRKMVNLLSTKMEIGSPMASMYLLGHPDHYASHEYTPFYWRSYVTTVRIFWSTDTIVASDLGPVDEKVTIHKLNGSIIAHSVVDDYMLRPAIFDNVTIYEWIQCASKKMRTYKERSAFKARLPPAKQSKSQGDHEPNVESEYNSASDDDDWDDPDFKHEDSPDDESAVYSDSDWNTDDEDEVIAKKQATKDKNSKPLSYPFMFSHPQFKTHSVSCNFDRIHTVIPNFLGGSLPRSDKGDHNFYCMTMLTIFKPWRSPADLKTVNQTWAETFSAHTFTKRQIELMANFNVRYECNDARDDHFAQMQRSIREAEANESFGSTHPRLGKFDKLKHDMNPDLLELGDNEDGLDEPDGEEVYVGPKTFRLRKQAEEMVGVLDSSGWLRKQSGNMSLLTPEEDVWLPPYQTRNGWTNVVKNERLLFTKNKLVNMPPVDKSKKIRTHWDEVEILNQSYFLPTADNTNETATILKTRVISKFSLNKEQARAFSILADHASSPQLMPLRMYLGGMGGTGKSQVIRAMVFFFQERNEAYRFIVLGPTGTVAALLNGSTYHSVFKIPRDTKSKNQDDIDGIVAEGSSLAAVNERLQGVDYIFLDEISMVSCNDLQQLATQAAKARNIHDSTFGGLSVITAGDFTQLPPTTGPSLYSNLVDTTMRSAVTIQSQNAVLGKILWHQFNIVVILRQNMRQKEQTEDDDKLRTALSNMRYGACTTQDVSFLRSRIASLGKNGPRLDSAEFRNVSIITALNSQKDVINELGTKRFAADNGKELVIFRSIDSASPRAVDKSKWKKCEQSALKNITPQLQRRLWESPPSCNSGMLPGTLALCPGMPVLLRSNDATELCITKGQEAVVLCWDESVGPSGQRVLDTLFVKLINTPRPIQLPDLPENVVPLVRTSNHITVLLEDDTLFSVLREQVVLLINFSMTDYSAQGKSRPWNIVDLTNCRDHRAFYVALSRATTAAGTVILQDFDEQKITKGMSGYLRQELRELEFLDQITQLRYENRLPREVTGMYRRHLIRSFMLWRKEQDDPEYFHPSIRWDATLDPRIPDKADYGEWVPSGHKRGKRKPSVKDVYGDAAVDSQHHSSKRRKVDCGPSQSTGNNPVNQQTPFPIGLDWDAENYSCAFDATFTVLFNTWDEDRAQWSQHLNLISPALELLGFCFELVQAGTFTFEQARDMVRRHMHRIRPEYFPYGQIGTSMDRVAEVLAARSTYAMGNRVCRVCGYVDPEEHTMLDVFLCAIPSDDLIRRYPTNVPIDAWFKEYLSKTRHRCPVCRLAGSHVRMDMITRITQKPSLLILSIEGGRFAYSPNLVFDYDGQMVVLKIRGIIYAGEAHFTCRFIDSVGRVWYHDGMTTRRACIIDGLLTEMDFETLAGTRGKTAVAVIYVI